MSLPVHLVPSLDGASVGSVVRVDGDEAHHAVAVRRMRVGEALLLTDGRGALAGGAVEATGKLTLDVRLTTYDVVAEPAPSVTVVQALAKGDRTAKSLARWRATAREAAKQSRRAWHPEVAEPASTGDVLEIVAAADLAVILHEEATGSLASLAVPEAGEVLLVVGPEGGLTDDEVTAFVAAGAHAVRLGTEVLRTSTAGVAATAAILARTPRWS